MVFRRLCLGPSSWDSPTDIRPLLQEGLRGSNVESVQRMNEVSRATEAIKALAICHNVTPVTESVVGMDDPEMDFGMETPVTYQASSPDEVLLMISISMNNIQCVHNFEARQNMTYKNI